MYSETKDDNEVDLFYFYHIVHSFTSFVHPIFLYLLCSLCVSLFPPSCVLFARDFIESFVCSWAVFLSNLHMFSCRSIAVPQLSSTTTRPLYPFNIHVRAYLKIVYLNNHAIFFLLFSEMDEGTLWNGFRWRWSYKRTGTWGPLLHLDPGSKKPWL